MSRQINPTLTTQNNSINHNSVTVSAWFKFESVDPSDYSMIVGKRDLDLDVSGYALYIDTSNIVRFKLRTGDGYRLDRTTALRMVTSRLEFL